MGGTHSILESKPGPHTLHRGDMGSVVHKLCDFSTKGICDSEPVQITGILFMSGQIVVADRKNEKLKVFSENGDFLACTDSKGLPIGMARSSDNRFVTCVAYQILTWVLQRGEILHDDVVYALDYRAQAVHCNGTYFYVLHHFENAITVLSFQGRQITKIVKKQVFGHDIHSDRDTHNVYVTCLGPPGVLCASSTGEDLWFTELCDTPWGITEIYGVVCVVSDNGKRVILLSQTGEKMSNVIFEQQDFQGQLMYIDANKNKMAVTHAMSSAVSVFHVGRLN